MNKSEFRLISFEVYGIKGISSPVLIQFGNSITKATDFDRSSIKIIYGPNGAGKTAIVTALSFYRRVVLDPGALNNSEWNHHFYTLCNALAKTIYVDVTFAGCILNHQIRKFKHRLEFALDEAKGIVHIEKEALFQLDGRNNETLLFEVSRGKLLHAPSPVFLELLVNRLDDSSLIAKTVALLSNADAENGGWHDSLKYVMLTFVFASSLYIYFGSDENVVYHPYILLRPSDSSKAHEWVKEIQDLDSPVDKRFLASVRHEDMGRYVKYIRCVERFVQLFKPELERIEIDKRDFNQKYWINLTFAYHNGARVDFENESTGIKKIVTLSNALEALTRGGIVIIDEIDTGIMDKIISEVVEYACKYAKGQLLLTTHHVGLMNVVKKAKHSIDFLSTDNVLTKWVNNGNYNPERVYLNGGIPHIPLNIHGFDFVDVFEGDGDDE